MAVSTGLILMLTAMLTLSACTVSRLPSQSAEQPPSEQTGEGMQTRSAKAQVRQRPAEGRQNRQAAASSPMDMPDWYRELLMAETAKTDQRMEQSAAVRGFW